MGYRLLNNSQFSTLNYKKILNSQLRQSRLNSQLQKVFNEISVQYK